MRRWLAVALVVVLAGIAAVVWYLHRPAGEGQRQVDFRRQQELHHTLEAWRGHGPPPTAPPSQPRQRLTPPARARLLEALQRARAARGGVVPAAPSPAGAAGVAGASAAAGAADGGVGSLDKEYIRAAIRELVPLVKECYDNALQEQPALDGRLTVEFRIAGEPEIGGVVTESRIVESDGGLRHAGLEECVRETMYGLQLDAPAGGGTVRVRYPFVFRTR
jgi:hypothetical protein